MTTTKRRLCNVDSFIPFGASTRIFRWVNHKRYSDANKTAPMSKKLRRFAVQSHLAYQRHIKPPHPAMHRYRTRKIGAWYNR